ncbi:hypothetical protein DEO72_LG6g628 [Vigna unguiculata]|uniref:Uncharacterized protein n=1 Tax=Vigna unguiculata TaxID=3917 RepID=A0A4D6M5F9_VIGUN|nr:hypothetical protein DEO72_LG6g627 [Vigna unguiculata]QCD95930.1 hypothetical protein DEO72_LG6g628 [Vigna unguiculata]
MSPIFLLLHFLLPAAFIYKRQVISLLPKPVRSQRELSVNTITKSSVVFSLAFREFQSVERRLESLSGKYRDGGASSSGIQSHSVLGGLQS